MPGQSYHLRIMPTLHVATPSFKNLELSERKCRMRHEGPTDSIFKSYSKKGCIFECTLKHVVIIVSGCSWIK